MAHGLAGGIVFGIGQKAAAPIAGAYVYTGTAYVLEASDNGNILGFNNAAAITVTIPATLPRGFNCLIAQIGAGQVTFAAGAGATIRQRQSFSKTAGQYALASIASPIV